MKWPGRFLTMTLWVGDLLEGALIRGRVLDKIVKRRLTNSKKVNNNNKKDKTDYETNL